MMPNFRLSQPERAGWFEKSLPWMKDSNTITGLAGKQAHHLSRCIWGVLFLKTLSNGRDDTGLAILLPAVFIDFLSFFFFFYFFFLSYFLRLFSVPLTIRVQSWERRALCRGFTLTCFVSTHFHRTIRFQHTSAVILTNVSKLCLKTPSNLSVLQIEHRTVLARGIWKAGDHYLLTNAASKLVVWHGQKKQSFKKRYLSVCVCV